MRHLFGQSNQVSVMWLFLFQWLISLHLTIQTCICFGLEVATRQGEQSKTKICFFFWVLHLSRWSFQIYHTQDFCKSSFCHVFPLSSSSLVLKGTDPKVLTNMLWLELCEDKLVQSLHVNVQATQWFSVSFKPSPSSVRFSRAKLWSLVLSRFGSETPGKTTKPWSCSELLGSTSG